MPRYDLILTDSYGQVLKDRYNRSPLLRASRIIASRTANRIGSFSLKLPADIAPRLVRNDNMVQVWREPDGGRMELWRPYFIRKRRYYFEDGQEFLEIGGPDCNDILRRRVVAERPDTTVSEKVQPIDDMMKEILFEAYADGANPSPAYGTRANSLLSIQPDRSQGPIINIAIPWEKLLTYGGSGLFAKLVEASRSLGVPIYFDVIPDTVTPQQITFKFVTNAYQPGRDLTDQITFSQAQGNMENPEYVEDATRAENYIYAFGQGETVDQHVEQVYDQEQIQSSAWGRIEGSLDASSQEDDAVADVANSALTSRQPKRSFYADPISTDKATFGKHWRWGDRVTGVYHGRFEAVVESITLTIEKNNEQISGRLRSE